MNATEPSGPPFPALIIGVGNEFRGDDAVGLLVARRARQQLPGQVAVREASGEGVALMEAWQGGGAIFLIDAVFSGAKPGTVFRFEAPAERLPAKFFHYSTHAFSVAEAIELARALGQLPPRLTVFGIEGKDFSAGEALSPEVEQAAAEVLSQVLREVQKEA